MYEVYSGCLREELFPGLVIIAEVMPHANSVALGIWLSAGSREDPQGKEGLAHFTEHLVFKGTEKHSAREIARIIDSLGGQMNAATSEEYTVYHATVLAEGMETALEIMAELVTSPRFAREDIERERGVILEEIREAEDSPDDVAMRLLDATLWGDDHPLGRPILGRRETVATLGQDELRWFFDRFYRDGRKAVVLCGKVDPEEAASLARKLFTPSRDTRIPQRSAPRGRSGLRVTERPIQQVHLALGFPTCPAGAPERIALEVLHTVLGGGMSSRLFQRVREERGLVYSVTSFVRYYTDVGYLGVYAAAEPNRAGEILKLIFSEVEDLARRGPREEELEWAKGRVRGLFLIGLETPAGRMSRLGWLEALGLPPTPPADVLGKLTQVTPDDIRKLAAKYLAPERAALALVGPNAAALERLGRDFVEVKKVA